jgi:hypothetical protein
MHDCCLQSSDKNRPHDTTILLHLAALQQRFSIFAKVMMDKLSTNSVMGAIVMGAAVGLVSGLTGVGAGVFLARSASEANSSAFIAFYMDKSIVGLAGAIYVGQTPSVDTWLYALAVLAGHDWDHRGAALVVANI